MKRFRREFLSLAGAFVATLTVAQIAGAQGYPRRPITLVVPYGAGGPTDTISRILAEGMRASLGRSLVIENLSGASGTIGVGRVAHASGDGYTLGIGNWSTHVLNSPIFPLGYDVLKDFEPISAIVREPLLIVGKKTGSANDLRELIAWLRANPGRASLGTTGSGGALHVAGILFQNETGTRLQPVPYRGGAGPAMHDLVAGQIDMMIDLSAGSLPQVRAGNIKAYGVTAATRLSAAPDIPTVDEAGLPGFYISNWHGLWAPKGTPKSIIAKLNTAVANSLADSTIRAQLAKLGQEIFPPEQQGAEALHAFQKDEVEKWWPIIKAAGIKAE